MKVCCGTCAGWEPLRKDPCLGECRLKARPQWIWSCKLKRHEQVGTYYPQTRFDQTCPDWRRPDGT